MFGPPQRFTAASTCSWLGHPVSGLRHYTFLALFRLAFASTSRLYRLISHNIVTRRPVLQKVRHHFLAVAVSACKHRVSGSLSLPSRGAFHLSLTVLCAIGSCRVFSLGGWSPRIPAGFLVSRRTQVRTRLSLGLRVRGLHPVSPAVPDRSAVLRISPASPCALQPRRRRRLRFGLLPFRSPLLRESRLISSPAGT